MANDFQNLNQYKMFIGGEWVEAASGEHFPSDNPYTGQPWASIPRGGAADAGEEAEKGKDDAHGRVLNSACP